MRSGRTTNSASSKPARATVKRGGYATLGLFLTLLVWSQSTTAADGRFEILSASARVENNIWLIDALLDLQLSRTAVEALENGVNLNIQLQYEVNRSRAFWVDETIVATTQDIEIQYLTLSQRYIVHHAGNGQQTSFASLFSALRSLRQASDFKLISADQLDPESRYWFAMRVVLDREKLPGPLQMLYFWRDDFSLESDWYTWTLE